MGARSRSSVGSFLIVGIIAVIGSLLFAPKLWTPGVASRSQIAGIQIKKFHGALHSFRSDTGRYPTTAEGLDALVKKPGGLESWKGPYLVKSVVPSDPWGRPYAYRSPGPHQAYDLLSYGSDGVTGGEGTAADVTNREIAPPRR